MNSIIKKIVIMSFGGLVSAMLSSSKNNARPKMKIFFNRNTKYSDKRNKKKNAFLDKNASPKLLAEIREN